MNRNKKFDRKRSSNRRDDRYDKKRGFKSRNPKEGAVTDVEQGEAMNNDANWYFTNKELVQQAAQLSYQSYLGVPNTFGRYTMPAIMTIHLAPSPGNTTSINTGTGRSGFNMAMVKMFNRLSMHSGRNMAYAPQDVGMAVLGMGELLSMTSYIRRLFGVAKWWNPRNRMIPKQVIKAMGIDPDDFFTHFSDYRMRANTLIMACNQIPILTNSGYLRKCASLYDKIYYDCDANMAQMYIYVPESTWILDEQASQTGTVAVTTPVVSAASAPADFGVMNTACNVRTFANFLTQVFEPMVQALLTSSTLNLVYADILNLNKYEKLELASLNIIDEAYAVVPEHDVMVLKQIHNSVAMGKADANAETSQYTILNNVVCDPSANGIKYGPAFINRRTYGTVDPNNELGDMRIIDTDNSNPDIVEKVEITRYTSTHSNAHVTIGSVDHTQGDCVTDHYVTYFIIYTNEIDSTHGYAFTSDISDVAPSSAHDFTAIAKALLSQFDWHPIIYHYGTATGASAVDWILSDLNSFTIIPYRYIERLNNLIYMELFDFR